MLFNTLANLRVLIGVDPPRAQAMLDRLIAFLRATLGASRAGMHTLAAEFDRLADYLALMAVRMGPRLEVRFDLPDELRDQPVPALLLQPLVENCVRHGLEPKVEGGRIEIVARLQAGALVLTVSDTGVGLDHGAANDGTGFGTTQVRQRLTALYGGRASFSLETAPGGVAGTLARIRLPLPA
jgi:LytS/YehU family sensor histidine kinase